jgi:hypothetical protein
MSHMRIALVRRSFPETLRYSQLLIAKKNAMCVRWWNRRRIGFLVGSVISFCSKLNGIAFCGCSAGSLFL